MTYASVLRRITGLLFTTLLVLPLAASADEETHNLPFSDLTMTEPDRHFSATQECVEPEEEMKRNHMDYILHQRDETMYDGIRTPRYSLEECINCHAATDEQGEYLPVNGPNQFCSSCHTYASVSIDCFQCHATKPVRASRLEGPSSGKAPSPANGPVTGSPSRETLQVLVSEGNPQ